MKSVATIGINTVNGAISSVDCVVCSHIKFPEKMTSEKF